MLNIFKKILTRNCNKKPPTTEIKPIDPKKLKPKQEPPKQGELWVTKDQYTILQKDIFYINTVKDSHIHATVFHINGEEPFGYSRIFKKDKFTEEHEKLPFTPEDFKK